MHISCPHCNAAYEVGPLIKNAILVCHRCHAEFNMGEEAEKQQQENIENKSSLPLFEHSSAQKKAKQKRSDKTGSNTSNAIKKDNDRDSEGISVMPVPAFLEGEYRFSRPEKDGSSDRLITQPEKRAARPKPKQEHAKKADIPLEKLRKKETVPVTEATADTEADTNADSIAKELTTPPARKRVTIWPWLVFILLLIGGTGFWYKKDAWLDHPWLRSVFINMHLPVEVRNKDWLIIPDSVQGQWLKRDNNSQVLVIQGRIENRLYCELPPPQILIRFFDDSGIDESLGEKLLTITEPPLIEQIKRAPFVIPPEDKIPVEAQGQRGFILVVESLPERTSDFTLTPSVQ